MDHSKTPHVCFKVALTSTVSVCDDLSGTLEKHLVARFDSGRVIKTGAMASWGVVLQVGQKSFTVLLDRSKYGNDEWILLVGSLDTPTLLERLLKRRPIAYISEQRIICREIHTILTTAPGISAIRWYFEGFHSQSEAVTTPDDLTWV